jgi:hypothetical protein
VNRANHDFLPAEISRHFFSSSRQASTNPTPMMMIKWKAIRKAMKCLSRKSNSVIAVLRGDSLDASSALSYPKATTYRCHLVELPQLSTTHTNHIDAVFVIVLGTDPSPMGGKFAASENLFETLLS